LDLLKNSVTSIQLFWKQIRIRIPSNLIPTSAFEL